jgi:hypothetical protein
VEPTELFGSFEPGREFRNRNRRGVRAEDCVFRKQGLQSAVKLLLGIGVLVDRLDDHIRRGELAVALSAVEQRREFQCPLHIGPLRFAIETGLGQRCLHAAADGFGRHISKGDGDATLDVCRGNALAHHARAHDRDRPHLARLDLAG